MRAWYKRDAALLGEIEAAKPADGGIFAWYIGQVGYVFKGGATVCVDPFLNDLADRNGRSFRLYKWPFEPGEFQPDYALCTHGHDDHMALPTLTAMAKAGEKTRFLVPAGCADTLERAGVDKKRIVPMQAKENIELPGLTVRPVQAAHPVHETDAQGRDLSLCLSLRLNGVEILHAGDTYLTDQLLNDLKALPKPDVFFTPVNGGDYFRTARHCIGNMNALESAKLAVILGAGVTVPTHFDLMEGNTCDPTLFVKELWAANPAARFRIPALGEKLSFEAERERAV